jgi:hypothetical protein
MIFWKKSKNFWNSNITGYSIIKIIPLPMPIKTPFTTIVLIKNPTSEEIKAQKIGPATLLYSQ